MCYIVHPAHFSWLNHPDVFGGGKWNLQ
jgi:hypothetical protein